MNNLQYCCKKFDVPRKKNYKKSCHKMTNDREKYFFFVELAVIFTKSQETGQLAVVLARPRVLFITRGLDDRELTPDHFIMNMGVVRRPDSD